MLSIVSVYLLAADSDGLTGNVGTAVTDEMDTVWTCRLPVVLRQKQQERLH